MPGYPLYGSLNEARMTSYLTHIGAAAFLLVFGLNFLNSNDYGTALMRACIGALGAAILSRMFLRTMFSGLQLSILEKQQAAAAAPVEPAPEAAPETEAATPGE